MCLLISFISLLLIQGRRYICMLHIYVQEGKYKKGDKILILVWISANQSFRNRALSLSVKKYITSNRRWVAPFFLISCLGYKETKFPTIPNLTKRSPLRPKQNLSKNVFERRTSTRSETFSHLTCQNATKIVLLSVLSLIKKICRNFG